MTLDESIAMPGCGTANGARCHLGRIEGSCVCVCGCGRIGVRHGCGQADTDACGRVECLLARRRGPARERKGRYA